MALELKGIDDKQVSALTTRTGKVTGTRLVFGGTRSASEVKAHLRTVDPKLKGAALQKRVNDVLTGREDMAWAEKDVLDSALRSAGYIPNSSDVRAKSACIRYVKPTEPAKAKLDAANEEINKLKAEIESLRQAISAPRQ